MGTQRLHDRLCFRLFFSRYFSTAIEQRIADFPNKYFPKNVENGKYSIWEENNYFPRENSEKESIRMILPPPNITGVLHLGHALTVTIQDVLARWYRMNGHSVTWIPGLDHAGIATQEIVERHLLKTKNITKHDIGREEFLSVVWKWKSAKESVVKSQLKAMGATLQWSKEYFTMSKVHNAAVVEAFVLLNERNLLYKEKDLINWSPSLCSAISDIEVEHIYVTEETKFHVPGYKNKVTFGQAAEIIYKIRDTDDEIVVTTTRPETVFGDVAIAVHPDDKRHAKYIGQQVWHPFRYTYIPIIPDECVDMDFGTGAVKVTPAHDKLDYKIAKKHGLEIITVIDDRGNLTDAANQYKGLPRYTARTKVLHELANKHLLKSIKPHKMCVPICSRSKDIVEYLLKEQWFVNCKHMAERAIDVARNGSLKIIPDHHEETWFNFLENIRNWCISRQLWWGHRIPAYTIEIDGVLKDIVARSEQEAQLIAEQKYGYRGELLQDSDVLDTWFSSGILPFAVMGWPNKDFEQHYPLTLMETGHDILFFWVARMVMLSLELTNRLPFKEVICHGVLCDGYGKKMSKTIGNVILPENIINGISAEDYKKQTQESHSMGILHSNELKRTLAANKDLYLKGIPECGADALRMTLCSQNIKSQTISFDINRCQTNTFFFNKIWQASKYVLRMTDDSSYCIPENLSTIDRWILSRLFLPIKVASVAYPTRDFHKIVFAIQTFAHYEFCDYYLEGTKWGFKSGDKNVIEGHKYTLVTCLEVLLRLIAPVAPFFADDLYLRLSSKLHNFKKVSSLLQLTYPLPEEHSNWEDKDLEQRMVEVIGITEIIRIAFAGVSKQLDPKVHVLTTDKGASHFYHDTINIIKGASRIWNISVNSDVLLTEENVIRHPMSDDCTILFELNDGFGLEKITKNIERRARESAKTKAALKVQRESTQV